MIRPLIRIRPLFSTSLTRATWPRWPVGSTWLTLSVAAFALSVAFGAGTAVAQSEDSTRDSDDAAPIEIQPRWLDRITDQDRAAVEVNIGFAPPPIPDDLNWYIPDNHPDVTSPPTWASLRGKVVVVQSLTTGSGQGRSALGRADRWGQRDGVLGHDDVVIIGVHTPENVDRSGVFLERREPDLPMVIDPVGLFCDKMGFYERPVNVVIDRHGTVRFAGLNESGLEHVVEALLAESFDEASTPDVHPEDKPAVDGDDSDVDFPSHNTRAFPARNLQGRQGPSFIVERWITNIPPAAGRVIVLDFWATWCGPCRSAIPHTNSLARQFARDVTIVGVSNESNRDFQEGMAKHDLSTDDFAYALAIDPDARMQSFFGVRAIPHVVVMSNDGTVRWQGSPSELTPELLGEIVGANRKLLEQDEPAATGSARRIYRWTQR